MNLEQYRYSTNETFLSFEFDSIGPKGKIRKIARFSIENDFGITYFNLGFGDLNEETGESDDLTVSNNRDREKILATVANIVIEFTTHFPDIMVHAQGSTPARTRLYQMGITAHWDEIEPIFHVFGFTNDIWQPFEKNVNYEAFFVLRKKL
jgi:hypothetical protein